MFGRRMTLKEQQEMVCVEILRERSREWRELELNFKETINAIVLHENQVLMEELFGTRFVHLANLFADSRALLNDIEELDNE